MSKISGGTNQTHQNLQHVKVVYKQTFVVPVSNYLNGRYESSDEFIKAFKAQVKEDYPDVEDLDYHDAALNGIYLGDGSRGEWEIDFELQ